MISWIRKHPWLATILSFVVVTAPQWIASVWALFSSEPLLPWLVRHNFPRLVFSPWWISGSIGAILLIVILLVLRRREVDASEQTSDIAFELTRGRWASPVLGTVINRNRAIIPLTLRQVACLESNAMAR
jgi:hypothetical protein